MFKRWISVRAPSRNNQNNENDGPEQTGSSASTNQREDNTRRSMFSLTSKKPTIIRPNDSLPSGKVRRPPRPPPPKFNTSGCVSAFSLDPPSYEEVLLADAKAKKNRLQDTTNKKRPAPQIPSSGSTRSTALIDSEGPSLIDFNTSLSSWDDFSSTSSHIGDLHELEDIFSSYSLGNVLQVASAGSVASTNSSPQNLLDDDIYVCADRLASLNTDENRNNALQNEEASANQTDQTNPSYQKPVPLPRLYLGNSNGATNDDLTHNILNSTNTSSTDFLGNFLNNEPLFGADKSEEEPPNLPPRPTVINDDSFSCEVNINSTSDQMPNLPPKPHNYKEMKQDVHSRDFCNQRLEPHGIALYDYVATQNDELSFQVNETVTLIHRINNEWLYGCVGEKEGMFPRSFLHIVIPLPDDPEFCNEDPSIKAGPRCLALYDYVGDSEEDLNFHVGTMIPLISKVSDHWFKGVLNGKIGLIPTNFVRVIEDLPDTDGANDMHEAEVTQDFSRGFNYELNCKRGDIIKIIYPIDNEWVMAQHENRAGILPWSILQVKH